MHILKHNKKIDTTANEPTNSSNIFQLKANKLKAFLNMNNNIYNTNNF